MSGPRCVAVVVTYNRQSQLCDTLDRLLRSPPDVLAAVVVCDNASSDGTAEYLKALNDNRVRVLRLPENRGGAGGFEAGMRVAMADHAPDWLILMDDDGRPQVGALEAFVSVDRSGAEAWAAAVRYPGGGICDMNRPWVNPFNSLDAFVRVLWRGRDGFHLGEAAFNAERPTQIDGGSFVGLFVSARAIEMAGYPEGALFLYGDDVLYTLGLSASGGTLMFDPALSFEHDCETLADGALIRPLWKIYFFHRNQIFVYRKAAGAVWFWPVFALRYVQWRRRAAAYGTDRDAYLALLRRAVRDGLKGRRGVTRDEIEEFRATISD